MTRRSLANLLSSEEPGLHDVWGWCQFQRALLGEEKSRVLEAFGRGEDLTTSRYMGKTREELDDDFVYQTIELGQMTKLGMLICTEAALRVDFIERVRNKRKDGVSRRFWEAYRAQGVGRIRLEEDILDVWRVHGDDARIRRSIAEFKGALRLRHWLAQGRYWRPKLGRASGYDVVDVFDICNELLKAVGLMPFDAPEV